VTPDRGEKIALNGANPGSASGGYIRVAAVAGDTMTGSDPEHWPDVEHADDRYEAVELDGRVRIRDADDPDRWVSAELAVGLDWKR